MSRNLLMLAVAGLVCFAMIHWHKSAPAPDSLSASVSAAADNVDETAGAMAPWRAYASRTVARATPTADELLARLINEIREQLNSGDEAGRDRVLTNLLLQLVALDPAAAGRLAESIEPGAGRNEVLRVVAQTWAGKDSTGALAWAAQLSDADEQRTTLAKIVFQMAQSDPAQAVAVARQYNLNDGAYDLRPSLAVQWAEKDLAAALVWAGNQPAGEERDQIMARISFVESRNAPAEAATRVLSEIPPGPVQDEAVMTVIHQWSLNDMPGAQAWAGMFPEGPLKNRALAELAVVASQQNLYASASASAAPNTP